MTSRVSFPKLLIETLRRHIAAVLIVILVFFIHTIAFFMSVQNTLNIRYIEEYASSSFAANAENTSYIIEDLTELALPNLGNAIIAMLIGAYLAFDFFRHLHSKKETDFYESMPIRKQKWFLTLMVASFGIFILLAALTTGLETAILYGTGYGTAIMLQNMLWNLLCMIGSFLAAWVTTVLAMVMTGHPIVAFLGIGVFASYIPLILGYLVPVYANKFFDTYVFDDLSTNYYYFSPASLVYKATHNWREWNIGEHWTYLLGCFVFTGIIGFIAYRLFLQRPSETAGRAMAFEKTNFIIRFLLVIPLSLYAGLLLSEMAAFGSGAWLIFGIIFAAFLLHGIMECIFQFDIKALISKKRQLLLAIGICLGFVFVFWFDLFGFDKYMPDADDLKAVKIDSYLFDQKGNETDEWADGLSGEYIDDALALIKEIQACDVVDNADKNYYMYDFTVTYQLNNGMERRRSYSYYGSSIPESLDKLYATADFKDDYCILYHLDKTEIVSVGTSNGPEYRELILSDAERQELFEIYLKEYTNITLSQTQSEPAVLELVLGFKVKGNDYSVSNRYNVYPSFTNSIAFLKEHGIMTFAESEHIKPVNLELYGGKYADLESPQYISDSEQLNELKQYMILADFMVDNLYEDYIYCNLRYEIDGATNYMNVFINPTDLDKVLKE